jgi:hypothetical protein
MNRLKTIIIRSRFALGMLIAFSLGGCIVVIDKEPETVAVSPPQYSPRSGIPVSGDILYSKRGDISFQVPKEWSRDLPPAELASVEAFASNENSSLLVVLSIEGSTDIDKEDIEKDDLEEMIMATATRRAQKSPTSITGSKDFLTFQGYVFGLYRTSNTGGAIESRNALTVTPEGRIYNIALIPVNDIMNKMPASEEIDRIFNEILYTVMM